MNFFQREFTFDRVVRIIITLAIIILFVYALNFFSSVLVPFFIALVFAYLLNPFFNFIQRFLKNRALSLFVGFIILIAIIVGICFIIIPMSISQIHHAVELVNNLISKTDWQLQLKRYLPEKWADKIFTAIQSGNYLVIFNEKQLEEISNFGIHKVLPQIGVLLGFVLDVVIGIVGLTFAIIYLFFILLDFNEVNSLGQSLIPPKYRNQVIKVIHDFEEALNRYFRGQALIALINGFLFTIGFIIIGLPLGVILGLITGLLVMVPYMHNLSLLPASFLAILKTLETGQPLLTSIGLVIIVFATIQIITDWVLTPIIMKNATGLNPAIILLSLSLWGKLLGILGLIIALPLTYLSLGYYRRFIGETKKIEGPSKPDFETEVMKQNLRKIPGDSE